MIARACLFLLCCLSVAARADDDTATERRSGYWYARPDTRAIQDDEFANPGYIWMERGRDEWARTDGAAGKSCQSCHGDAAESMRGVGATYPKVDETGRLINLRQRINRCRVEHMEAEPLAPRRLENEIESEPLLALEIHIRAQSAGMPVDVATDGPAAPFYERGRALYHKRIGQMDLACTMCHDQRTGHYLRAEHISQGQINNFPAYILRWDSLASSHRRFQFCNDQARAEPLPIDSDDYNALELYVAARGNGLPVEVPAVRR
jgi:sulfur-oxidizing protein SoxA